jgi:hypothetical protein
MSLGNFHGINQYPGRRTWNQFVDRDAISAWAAHSGLVVESFFDGDKGHIPIPEEIRWENGMCMKSLGNLGQSVAVLRKR